MYGPLQWMVSEGGKDSKPDAPAQAGFVSDDGRHQTLIGSGTADVLRLSELTNAQMPGLFLFRISGEAPLDPRTEEVVAGNAVEETDTEDYIGEEDNIGGYLLHFIAVAVEQSVIVLKCFLLDLAGLSQSLMTDGGKGKGKRQGKAGNDLDDYDEDYDYPECPSNQHMFCPSSCNASTDENGCPLCTCPEEVVKQSPEQTSAYCSKEAEIYLECGSGCPMACDNLYQQPLACAEQVCIA